MGQLQAAIRQRWEVHEKTLVKVVHDTSVYEDAEDGRRAGPGIWHDGSLLRLPGFTFWILQRLGKMADSQNHRTK